MADVLVDSRRTLIASPEGAKWPWAEELQKRTGEAALVLEGRGAREARRLCLACSGRGMLDDGKQCETCKSHNGQSLGYIIYEARRINRPVWEVLAVINGTTVKDRVGYQCTAHPEVRSKNSRAFCGKCWAELQHEVRNSRYVIINYDLIIGQKETAEDGEDLGIRKDLPGWAQELRNVRFDVCIADEGHNLRGRPKKKNYGLSRRERLIHALGPVPRVYGLTATPIYGFTRDIWGLIDVVSKGLMGKRSRLFDERYCEGHQTRYGWYADGRSIFAETELEQRMKYFMFRREKSELLSELPKISQQVIHVDAKTELDDVEFTTDKRSSISRALMKTMPHKLDTIVENVLQDLAEGNKAYVLAYHIESIEMVYDALYKAITSKKSPHHVRMTKVNARLWLAHGPAGDGFQRNKMAREYREWEGAGVFLSTIPAMAQGGISLLGASTIHVTELDWSPAALEQAMERPAEVGVVGLMYMFYVVRRSADEHVLQTVLPKIDTQVKLTGDKEADRLRTTLGGEEETVDQIWARLTAHLEAT